MKKWIFILSIALMLFGKDYYAQRHVNEPGFGGGPRKRIEELEKLKLIEVLNLDEKTMLQFFSRRNDFNRNIRELEEEKNDKLDKIKDLLDSNAGDQEFKKVINEIINIDNTINKTREDYMESLEGLLTNEQRAKVLLFDRNFKKEIKEIILKHRIEN